MKKFLIFLFTIFILISCNQRKKNELKKYDENGKLMIYNEEQYFKLVKGKNVSFTIVDTFCTNQKSRAIKDIKRGKLIYFGFHPREFKKMSTMLKKYGIEMKEQLKSDLIFGGFRPYCYEEKMYDEICRKYGNRFIDSIFKVAQKEYVIENPDVEYMEDGIDLREKYLNKKTATNSSL